MDLLWQDLRWEGKAVFSRVDESGQTELTVQLALDPSTASQEVSKAALHCTSQWRPDICCYWTCVEESVMSNKHQVTGT